jgi:preprotein translocase subunit SecE
MQNAKISFTEIGLWVIIAILTLGAFFGTYNFSFTTPIQVLIWISWLVLIMITGYFTTQGQQVFAFSKEAKIELKKVVWPERQEAIKITAIVMAMVAITGFVLWGIDSLMLWGIGKITHLG